MQLKESGALQSMHAPELLVCTAVADLLPAFNLLPAQTAACPARQVSVRARVSGGGHFAWPLPTSRCLLNLQPVLQGAYLPKSCKSLQQHVGGVPWGLQTGSTPPHSGGNLHLNPTCPASNKIDKNNMSAAGPAGQWAGQAGSAHLGNPGSNGTS